jgi:hypothetical protein
VYIGPNDDITVNNNDERNIFKNQLDKFIDKSIDHGLYSCLYSKAKAKWGLNIKILDETAVSEMIRSSLNYTNTYSEEIPMPNHNREWIYQLWNNITYRNWDLTKFEGIHLIPTSRTTLRKLKTPKKIFSSKTSRNASIDSLVPIFERFCAVFINKDFEEISEWYK